MSRTFDYRALDASGAEAAGTLSAEGRAAAIEEVVRRGLHPVSVEERQEAAAAVPLKVRPGRARVPQAGVDAFTRELANLLAAGVPLSRALRLLARQSTRAAERAQRATIYEDVVGGMSLADALARWPRSFPPVHVAMVRAGETGGFLDVVLEQVADFRTWEQGLRGKVRAALVYPTVLAVLASGVLTFLLLFFIPKFSNIFAEFGGQLPLLTRAIVAASRFVIDRGPVVLAGLAVLVLLLRRFASSEAGRRAFERLMLRAPLLGTVVARFALIRFCRMLGTLLQGGVALVPALRVAREAIGHQTLSDAITRAVEDVQHGASLSRSLGAADVLFPPIVVEMVAVAEESGRLDTELLRVAASYDTDLDRRLSMLVALVEPALLFCMAGIVGTVVIGMLLPIFLLQDLIK